MATVGEAAPLDDVMLAMDVVDTLRHSQDLVSRELDTATREAQLIEKLREIYRQQGIEVPDHILKEGVGTLAESRFVYTPAKSGLGHTLARFYVSRKRWGPAAFAIGLMLTIGLGGYFLAYKPYQAWVAENARLELAENLPAQMDQLYQSIFDETKVQMAVGQAEQIRVQGKNMAAAGDRAGAEKAIQELTALRDQLRQEYTLRIVNRQGVKSGFWTFPEINTAATNYYVVVEALDSNGKPLTLPIANEENGETENVSIWGLRVPEAVYLGVAADKQDNGIIEQNIIGKKEDGFLDVEYAMTVLGGTVTRW